MPASLEEWLRLLWLEEYGPQLRAHGYHTIQVTAIQPNGVAAAAAAGGVRASAPSTGIPHYPGKTASQPEEYGPLLRAQGYHTIQVKLPASLEEWLRLGDTTQSR